MFRHARHPAAHRGRRRHRAPHRACRATASNDPSRETVPRSSLIEPVLIDLPSSIDTPRLTLRPPRAGDGPALHEALTESLTELRRFLASLPWVAAEQTPESAETFCRNGEADFIARRDLPFLVFEKASGRLVASAGLHRTVWQTPKSEVGYWCRTGATGQGFVTEAVEALARYAFRHIRAVRVELFTDERNTASRRVAERTGFVLEGILRDERRAPDASLRSTCVYARFPTDIRRSE